jgi:hypothetical protein
MAYPPPYRPVPQTAPTNGMAIGALVSGIVSWVALPLLAAVPAVILGHLALKQIRRTGEEGTGLATAGLVLGYLNLVASLVFVCFFGTVLIGCFAAAFNLDSVTTTPLPSPTDEPFTFSPSPEPLPS